MSFRTYHAVTGADGSGILQQVGDQRSRVRDRLRFLTPISLHCTGLRISPDGKQLVYLAVIDGKPNLWSRSLEEANLAQHPGHV